jgi:arylsulfatase A-like enzyme
VFTAGGGRDLLDYIEPTDWLLLLLPPLVLYLFSQRAPQRWNALRDRVVLGLCLLCALLYVPLSIVARPNQRGSRMKPAMATPPAFFLARDVIAHLRASPNSYARLAEQLPRLRASELFFDQLPGPLAAPSPPAPHGAWNVLLVIMESTGARYAFDEKRANQVPMPIVADLAAHGLYLARHYASANTSPRAIFSIFTGLYPEPMETMFCTRPDVRIPGLGSLLGPRYDRFFITPGRLKSYLPLAMLEHQGVSSVYGYDELPSRYVKPFPGAGRNEVDTASFFIDRLAHAREPFFATYYSYAPHYDYFDHGEPYRILADLDDPENRYYNNLRLLDTQIGRFIDALRTAGKLDDTVVLLVGDHGEGFGQHPGNYTHSRGSFEENLRVPAVIYQPKLFAPQKMQQPTTHADLLPTLLDALNISYDQRRIQGQSLLRGTPNRRYIYSWGNEGTLTSIDTQSLRKLHISFTNDSCRYYELKEDSHEHADHPCGPESEEQFHEALRYQAFQAKALQRYNSELLKQPSARR